MGYIKDKGALINRLRHAQLILFLRDIVEAI